MVKLGRNRIVYKKVWIHGSQGFFDSKEALATLRIPKGAYVRESIDIVGQNPVRWKRKNRASKAKVLQIVNLNYGKKIKMASSTYSRAFKYQVGRIVKPRRPFNKSNSLCGSGIHFFKHKKDARNY